METTTPTERLFLYESNKLEGENSLVALEDAITAWSYAKTNKPNNVIHNYVQRTHFLLMRRININIGGKYRDVRMMVGDREDTSPPEEVYSEMEEWCNQFNEKKNSKEEIKNEHIKFLKIHPFLDGNGRTARILMNVQRLNSGYGLIIIKEGIAPTEAEDYYRWFK